MIKRAATVSALLAFIAVALITPHAWHYGVNHNWRTVEEGVLYGSRQMDPTALEEAFQSHGIRTVVNMRSENPGATWFDEEVATCEANGVHHVSFPWSKNALPSPESLLEYLDLIEHGQPPFLVHCQGGTHRTGVAAAAHLLNQGHSPETARKQFTLGFNNAPIGQLVDLYEGSPLPFRLWVEREYPQQYEQWKAEREQLSTD